jgi:hypothetical protein
VTDKDKLKAIKMSAGLKALAGPDVKAKRSESNQTNPKGVLIIRFIFKCKQCDKVFPIEDISEFRTALSIDHAQELLAAFAKTVEPRTITCSCSHESEYHQRDVGFSWE